MACNHNHIASNKTQEELAHRLGKVTAAVYSPQPNDPPAAAQPENIYLISVDGKQAPLREHATLEEARVEAQRLVMTLPVGARVRVLKQEGYYISTIATHYYSNQD